MDTQPLALEPDEETTIQILGKLIPYKNNKPVVLQNAGTNLVPIFSDSEILDTAMKLAKTEYDCIKQIHDDVEFVQAIPFFTPTGIPVQIIIDPHLEDDNHVHWGVLNRTPLDDEDT